MNDLIGGHLALQMASTSFAHELINNGTVNLEQGATFTNNNSNALNNVTLNAPAGVDITGGYLRVNNGTINANVATSMVT